MMALKLTLGLQKKYLITFHAITGTVNSILAHNKISLLTTYNIVQKLDIIRLNN